MIVTDYTLANHSVIPLTPFSTVSNRFCDDWIQAFLNAAERCNPFLLRQILENFKLKVGKHTAL